MVFCCIGHWSTLPLIILAVCFAYLRLLHFLTYFITLHVHLGMSLSTTLRVIFLIQWVPCPIYLHCKCFTLFGNSVSELLFSLLYCLIIPKFMAAICKTINWLVLSMFYQVWIWLHCEFLSNLTVQILLLNIYHLRPYVCHLFNSNVANNRFTGWIPGELISIPNFMWAFECFLDFMPIWFIVWTPALRDIVFKIKQIRREFIWQWSCSATTTTYTTSPRKIS